ncbi:MAG: lamin tail domain-containing protein [bacterium]|nr:lamin tail domain-containing protein [bacterium]
MEEKLKNKNLWGYQQDYFSPPEPEHFFAKYKIFFRFIKKMFLILTIVCLNWSGFSAVWQTSSYFLNNETSSDNVFSASDLDFSLSSAGNFLHKVTPVQKTSRTIDISSNGFSEFNYIVKSNDVSGDLCSSLILSANLNGVNKYAGPISGLNYSAGQFGTVGGNWQFETNLIDNELSLQNKNCVFDFVFDGSQISGAGFFDQETTSNSVTSGYWSVVLNEFLPNPTGNDLSLMPAGEWVEIYNNSPTDDFDVNGWYLYDADGQGLLISTTNSDNNGNLSDGGETLVPAQGFLVVYLNGAFTSDWLNNSVGDTISLYDGILPGANLVDLYHYSIDVEENKSFARIPDGTGAWVDPIPTPGSPNTLECAEKSYGSSLPESEEENNNLENILSPDLSLFPETTPEEQEEPQEQSQEETVNDEGSTAPDNVEDNNEEEIINDNPVEPNEEQVPESLPDQEQIVEPEENIEEPIDNGADSEQDQ